mmetsp:Transcript_146524/g.467999  ORF Transcript_146524/g.467999 Transcript_146524/m.467999 type:complete len:243 (+) Transcript_146524:52-780(+)
MLFSRTHRRVDRRHHARARPGCSAAVAAVARFLAFVLLLVDERKRHRCVFRRHGAAVELVRALAIRGFNLVLEILGLLREVARVRRALGDLAELLLVALVGVHGEAPRNVHATVRIPAVVVVAEAVAPRHRLGLLVNLRLLVRDGLNRGCLLPRVSGAPLLAGAATDRRGDQATVAAALGATLLEGRRVRLHEAAHVEGGELCGWRADDAEERRRGGGGLEGQGRNNTERRLVDGCHGCCWR